MSCSETAAEVCFLQLVISSKLLHRYLVSFLLPDCLVHLESDHVTLVSLG